MSLFQKIQSDLVAAQKEKNVDMVSTLRLMVNDIKNIAINSGGDRSEISDDDAVKALTKAVKQRKDSIQMFRDNNRDDLASKEEIELNIIKDYLPETLSLDEIEAVLRPIISDAEDKNFGNLMKLAMQQMKGKADSSDIKDVIQKLLQGQS